MPAASGDAGGAWRRERLPHGAAAWTWNRTGEPRRRAPCSVTSGGVVSRGGELRRQLLHATAALVELRTVERRPRLLAAKERVERERACAVGRVEHRPQRILLHHIGRVVVAVAQLGAEDQLRACLELGAFESFRVEEGRRARVRRRRHHLHRERRAAHLLPRPFGPRAAHHTRQPAAPRHLRRRVAVTLATDEAPVARAQRPAPLEPHVHRAQPSAHRLDRRLEGVGATLRVGRRRRPRLLRFAAMTPAVAVGTARAQGGKRACGRSAARRREGAVVKVDLALRQRRRARHRPRAAVRRTRLPDLTVAAGRLAVDGLHRLLGREEGDAHPPFLGEGRRVHRVAEAIAQLRDDDRALAGGGAAHLGLAARRVRLGSVDADLER